MVDRKVVHELVDASPKLIGEVRRRRSDERVDVVAGDLGHGLSLSLPSAAVRRLSAAEVGLVVTIVIWSINFTLTKYVLDHGFQPLAYSAVRFTTAALIFCAITLALERSLRMGRRDLLFLFGAAVGRHLAQPARVRLRADVHDGEHGRARLRDAADLHDADREGDGRRAALEALRRSGRPSASSGVALVALGAHGEVAGSPKGILLALLGSATWAVYSVAIAPLMRRYSPFRISAARSADGCRVDPPDGRAADRHAGLGPRRRSSGASWSSRSSARS